MKTSENRKFEEEWKNAMEGAEIAPSDHVWDSIDLKLSHAERGEMKKRVLFYQRLAAASVLFALCLGAAGWFWNYEETGAKSLANQSNGASQNKSLVPSSSTSKNNSDAGNAGNDALASVSESSVLIENGSTRGNGQSGKAGDKRMENAGRNPSLVNEISKANNGVSLTSPTEENGVAFIKETKSENQFNAQSAYGFENMRVTQLATNDFSVSPIRLTSKPVEQIESARTFKTIKKEERNADDRDKNWWASLNGSGGAYNQSSTSNAVAAGLYRQGAISALNTNPKSTEAGVGTSFSYGVSLGKKIARRWIVMGGVNYLNQSIEYNSNIVLQDAGQPRAFVADLASATSYLASTPTYVLRNTNEFISIPVQAGYLLVNRKAGLQLNAGVAADIFYRNTMTDLNGQFGSFSQEAGDNSAYRSLNWTGLVGTELSYKMNNHYHVSLIPGFRYSFNSVLKSSTGSTINPLVWDVGFRLKYVF